MDWNISERIELIIASGDKQKMKSVFTSESNILSEYEQYKLLKSINDPEFIKECFRNRAFKMSDLVICKILIKMTGDDKFIEEQANGWRFKKEPRLKVELLATIKDEKTKKKYINDKTIPAKDRAFLIFLIYRPESKDLENDFKEWDTLVIKALEQGEIEAESDVLFEVIDMFRYEEEKIAALSSEKIKLDLDDRRCLLTKTRIPELESQILEVDKISEVSLDDLETMPDNHIVRTRGIKNNGEEYNWYTKEQFIAIKKTVDRILEGIEKPIKGDAKSELEAFKKIYGRLAMHISYDCAALKSRNENNKIMQTECRNLYGGLVKGKAVCAGYAVILAQILHEVGIEAQYIRGDSKNGKSAHAWTQVKIGRKMV